MVNKGKKLLSDLKFYDSYSVYREELGRKETWEESVDSVMDMHYNKFAGNHALKPYLLKATEAYKEKRILASQRSLQYREPQVLKHNHRLFNCSSTFIDRPEVFKEIMYVLLGGCGVGYSVERRFVNKLPLLSERDKENVKNYVIEDSIEGWSLALNELMFSFFDGSSVVRFDGSQIRPEGAHISGNFKAPGYEPLRKSLEMIENLIEQKVQNKDFQLTSLDCHEIICISSDAVLAAGVRRSALIALFDKDDDLMLNCKTGDWFYKKPWLGRANNTVKLIKGSFTEEEFNFYKESIKEFGEPGLALVGDKDFCTNPCFEIGFIPINPKTGKSCWSFCNLNEVNGSMCKTVKEFYAACEAAAILGTLQASYTNIPFLGKDTKELMEWEALLGVSITGIFDNPKVLLSPEVLQQGAKIVKETNKKVAEIIGINQSARTTCIKPSGNASVLLGTSSGIHPAHSKTYFRIMQMNKGTEMAKVLAENNPSVLEESVWSSSNSDYAVYIPIEENGDGQVFKDSISDLEFMNAVEVVYKNWVLEGTNKDLGYSSRITHNVSNTISVQNWDRVFEHIYYNQDSYCGLSFMAELGDKVYKQAPFTKIMSFEELTANYGEAAIFASGLIVDALHHFNNDLWDACEAVKNKDYNLVGDRHSVLLKKDIIRRIKKFSKNYLKGNVEKTIDCLKNIFIYHKYQVVKREFKDIDFEKIELKPTFTDVNTMGGVSCSGGACELIRI